MWMDGKIVSLAEVRDMLTAENEKRELLPMQKNALSQAETVRKVACKAFRLDFGYLDMNAVMKVLKDMGLPQSDQDFGTACSLRTRVPLSQEQDFRDRIGSACTLTEI